MVKLGMLSACVEMSDLYEYPLKCSTYHLISQPVELRDDNYWQIYYTKAKIPVEA